MTDQPMSRAERLELAKVVRQRAKVAKEDVAVREARILADAETALSKRFEEQDQAWKDITAEARQYLKEVEEKIEARCDELGIPVQFRPGYATFWMSRGENADPKRRAEIRATLKANAAASAKAAKLEIERQSVQLQEQLMAGGLESNEARAFLEGLPSPEGLMPDLDLPEIEGPKS